MINNKSEILNKLFFNELRELIDKYNNIDKDTITVIEKIDNEIEDKYIKEYILNNTKKLDEIINEYKDMKTLDIDKIIFFAWYNLNMEDISIKNISIYYDELLSQNYTDNENYLIYTNENDLTEYLRTELDYMLDMEYHLDRLLDKDMIIDMWLNNTTKEELLEEIMLNDDIEDILDISPEYAFTLTNGIEYKYSLK